MDRANLRIGLSRQESENVIGRLAFLELAHGFLSGPDPSQLR